MNKILRYSFVALLAMIGINASLAANTTVTFTLNDATAIEALGIALPEAGKGTKVENMSKDGVNIVCTTAEGKTDTRIYQGSGNNAGKYDFRIYTGGTMTFTAGTNTIRKIAFTGNNTGNIGGTWTGAETSVTLTATGSVTIYTIEVTYGDQPEGGDTPTFPTAANIGAFKALESGTEATLTLANAQVLFKSGNDIYVKDATGAIDFYKTGFSLKAGDVLNGTITGKYSPFNNLPEFVSTENTGLSNVTVTEGTATAKELTLAGVTADEICNLIKLTNVKVTQKEEGTYTNNYATDGTNEVFFYNKFSVDNALSVINTEKPDNTYDIEGILVYQSGKLAIAVTKAVVINTETGEAYQFVGDGSKANPYTVDDVKHITDYPEDDVWVKGWILGSASSGTKLNETDVDTNIAIGSTADATSFIPVAVAYNTNARAKLNVKDNPTNKGKEVSVLGKIQSYFSVTGVKDLKSFILNGTEEEVTGISAIQADASFKNAPAYNMAGQRVNEGYKGLVIKGGKKIIVK